MALLGGRYELGPLLGEGGMGAVHRARDHVLRREVAIKLLKANGEPESVARFLREGHVAAALSHPHIVRIFDAGQEGDTLYLVMELLAGQPLRVRLGDATPLAQKLAWLRQVASALAALHAAGVVHRDVKPANVVVDTDGTAKLIDLGIAKPVAGAPQDFATESGFVVGTMKYMAPEQLTGGPITPACDQFSWGLVAFELLVGQHPDDWARARGVAELPPLSAIVPGVPPTLDVAVARAVRRIPEHRFPDMATLMATLDGYATSTTPQGAMAQAPPTLTHTPAQLAHAPTQLAAHAPTQLAAHAPMQLGPRAPARSSNVLVGVAVGVVAMSILGGGAAAVALKYGIGATASASPLPSSAPAISAVTSATTPPSATASGVTTPVASSAPVGAVIASGGATTKPSATATPSASTAAVIAKGGVVLDPSQKASNCRCTEPSGASLCMLENTGEPQCTCEDTNGTIVYDTYKVCEGPPKDPTCKKGDVQTGTGTRRGPGLKTGGTCSGWSSAPPPRQVTGKLAGCNTCSRGFWPNQAKIGSVCQGTTPTGERRTGVISCIF